MTLKTTDLETLFEELAQAIDTVEPARASLYLTKLVVLLANQIGDLAAIRRAMAAAQLQLKSLD